MRLLISFFIFILFFSATCFAETTIESLPHQGEQSIIKEIKSAKQNIQITMYGFTDREIAKALIYQQQQGVKVQLLIETSPYKSSGENTKIIKQLKKANIEIHYTSSKYALTHQKTLLIDHKRAVILTGNFTYSGFYRQRNFIATTNDKEIVENLNRLFIADWTHTSFSFSKNSMLVLSPENSWPTLKSFITATHNTLDIYALEITDKRVIHLLLKQKAKIRIIIARSTKSVDINRLCHHHIQIHQLENIEQHAKALLHDYGENDALAYIGSANLTYFSLSKNREVGILFSDQIALNELNATFKKDWQRSRFIC